jgi:peptide chain release factor 2
MQREAKDLHELFELASDESDEDELVQLEDDLSALDKRCEQVELSGLLSRDEDMKNCFFSIHAGAGGRESCDWANMLLRMYTRYFEANKYKFQELDITPGEEALLTHKKGDIRVLQRWTAFRNSMRTSILK